jgi:hypothetical protein
LSTDVFLLALRALTAVLLLGFLSAIFWVLWRDFRAAASTLSEGQRQRGRLVVMHGLDGAATGKSFPLLPLTSLGRSPTNSIVLDEPFCSQEHALVTRRGGQWWLEDRNSSNGTLLNDEPVREPVVVSTGDVIGIGQILLKVELEE